VAGGVSADIQMQLHPVADEEFGVNQLGYQTDQSFAACKGVGQQSEILWKHSLQ